MNRFLLLLAVALAASTTLLPAQTAPSAAATPIPDFTVYAGAPAQSIEVATAFPDPGVTDAVRMTTVLGNIDIELFGQQTPITVTNFVKYVDEGRYFLPDPTTGQMASSFVHRAFNSPNIVQGGGFIGTVDPSSVTNPNKDNAKPTQVLAFAAIQNEPGISNKRGTIAMAKLGGNANSATSQWFINVNDNPSLDSAANNGGYTVFGRVVNGMSVVDAIFAVPRFDASGTQPPSGPFTDLPLRNYTSPNVIKVANLVSLPAITHVVPLQATADNANVSLAVSGSKLLLSGKAVGMSHVTVTTTDFDGATTSQTFTVNVIAAPGRLVNLSTRMQVGTGDNALIAGFIMRGADSKRLAVRAIGPSTGLGGAVADPTLELRDSTGATVATNDNWADAANQEDVSDIGLAPGSPNESVILTTVPSDPSAAAYTAIMRGANNTTGLGVVEVYDLDSGPGSTLLNISTRGQVGTDPNALIGGFTLGGTEPKTILVRAIGPSLSGFGVPDALVDPTLELRNAQGQLVTDANDDWMNSPQKTEIQNSGLAPSNAKESAVLQTLGTGAYTAIVRGANGGTGVGSVEVYQLP